MPSLINPLYIMEDEKGIGSTKEGIVIFKFPTKDLGGLV
jgi:hypothetical protein